MLDGSCLGSVRASRSCSLGKFLAHVSVYSSLYGSSMGETRLRDNAAMTYLN